MNFEDVFDAYWHSVTVPPWQCPKPCVVCHVEFIPADPRQECCPQHHRELIIALASNLNGPSNDV